MAIVSPFSHEDRVPESPLSHMTCVYVSANVTCMSRMLHIQVFVASCDHCMHCTRWCSAVADPNPVLLSET